MTARPHPRRAARALALLVLLAAAFATGGCGEDDRPATKYFCPMHPTYVASRPGDCPICFMRLVPAGDAGASPTPVSTPPPARTAASPTPVSTPPPARTAASPTPRFWRHPMNPAITSAVPAKDEMGMDYVPVYDAPPPGAGAATGLATVEIEAGVQRLSGVRTAEARRETLATTVRTVGTVTADQSRVQVVHSKAAGWVERLHVNFTGQAVRRGQPVLELYSPELLASQEELLRVQAAAERLERSTIESVREGARAMRAAARRRLELLDVPGPAIDELLRTRKVRRAVTLLAPVAGHVSAKSILAGQRVEAGQELFEVADLDRVWIDVDLYEPDAARARVGLKAVVSSRLDPALRVDGRVDFVSPFLTVETRTLRARVEAANPELRLRPGMYVDVEVELASAEAVVVPDSAVIDTGTRRIVFVEIGPGRFEPREIRAGARGSGRFEVLEGVRAGERVATHANFLLDSESRLRAAIAGAVTAGQTPARTDAP